MDNCVVYMYLKKNVCGLAAAAFCQMHFLRGKNNNKKMLTGWSAEELVNPIV